MKSADEAMSSLLRILLVDDDQDILDLGLNLLREAGFNVTSAVSGDVAEILLEQGLPFDMLITDVVFPGMLDGFGLARRAKQILPCIRVIYTTGFSAMVDVRSRGAPSGEILAKPWGSADLLNRVRSAIATEA